MLLGYNTNGFAHHPLVDAIAMLADLGYQSVAITLDYHSLNPFDPDLTSQLQQVKKLLIERRLACTIETGARFLLDPWQKHWPTLLSPDPTSRQIRRHFLQRAIDIASELGSNCVSLWSGSLNSHEKLDATQTTEVQQARLAEELRLLTQYAAARNIQIGFEPEPGMLIDTMARWDQLLAQGGLEDLRLTLDIGHLHCQGEFPIAEYIRRYGERLINVHLEDMKQGIHEHLQFGEGEMDFPPIIAALQEIQYQGPIHVELSRHSHMAPMAAQAAWQYLSPLVSRSQNR